MRPREGVPHASAETTATPSTIKEPNLEKLAEHYAAIIAEIGGDLNSEGIRGTPIRAARALLEMTEGARMGTERLATMLEAECHQAVCHDMVIVEGIEEVGLCGIICCQSG